MGRKLLADPELPIKLQRGKPEDVRPCIYCYVCVSQIFINQRVKCAVNPQTGHEFEWPIEPAITPKRVLVIGGGPAGMEAARVAALRGHRVTLVERADRLGGTLFFAALAYPENGALLDHLVSQVRQLPIELRLGTAATPALVAELRPDAVIVATGSEVQLALHAQAELAKLKIPVRVVSMPCTSVFDRQDLQYKKEVLPSKLPRIAVEAGVTDFWWKYGCAAVIGIDSYGESAPAGVLFKHFGFTEENVADTVRAVLQRQR